jgi:alanyl-tRNA synthetase
VSEGSIGSNTRRIEAVAGSGSLALLSKRQRALEEAARLLHVGPEAVPEAIERVIERQRQTDRELQRLRGAQLEETAARVAQSTDDGVVVHREDGLSADQLRDLARAVQRRGPHVVVVAGTPDGAKVALAVASSGPVDAGATVRELAQFVGGGGGGSSELAQAGGREVAKIDAMLAEARRRLSAA